MHNLQTHTDTLCTIYKYPRARCTFYKHTRAHYAQFTSNLKQQTRADSRGRPQRERIKRGRSCFGKTEKCILTLCLSLSHTHMSNKVQLVELVLYKLIKTKPPYALWPGRRMLCDLAVVCFAHKRCRILCAEGRRMLCVIARRGPLSNSWVGLALQWHKAYGGLLHKVCDNFVHKNLYITWTYSSFDKFSEKIHSSVVPFNVWKLGCVLDASDFQCLHSNLESYNIYVNKQHF